MAIPLGQVKEAFFQARKISPAVSKATKQTMRVLYNEGNVGSLTSMLKGKADSTVKAIMDDMQFPSSKTAAGYAKDGYPLASMAKLPKGTVTNRAGSGAGLANVQRDLALLGVKKPVARPAPGNMRARVKSLARNQELGAIASSGRPAPAVRNSSAKSAAIAKRKAILKNMKNRK